MQTSNRKQILIVAAVLLGILAVIFIPRIRQRWTEPLGPGLGLATRTPTSAVIAQAEATNIQAASPSRTQSGEDPEQASDPVQATETTAPTPTTAPLCGGPPEMIVLARGIDGGEDY